ncbi:glycosyltransferase family protein [Gelidibacter gilvus]|uniref:Glycosyltransferase family 1 protein n=1 Tax=Gelidibacter gilvus TaxID=59602 RepID=A0A4Q0XDK8_9FLAO|nr:hypothetical protein [Gelidibacter gilvus]RXJ46041.1 hypothetical protein ESZ48_13180 [Gelidibacter gilvus]
MSNNVHPNNTTEIILVTTKPNTGLRLVALPNIQIIRYRGIEKGMSAFKKLTQYIYIYSAVIMKLFKYKPQSLFFYETLSSFPFVVYSLFYKKINLYIHYHELFTIEQLKKGRPLHNFLNRLEKRYLYAKAKWISETNRYRMKIFIDQYHLNFDRVKHRILPNYPPKKWIDQSKIVNVNQRDKSKIKLLHIGSLSFETMYLNEVLKQYGNHEKFEITFYSHLRDRIIIEKLTSYDNVTFKGSLNYDEIPNLKGLYDVGLVLYKGNSLNFTYNAPNKIFEYLALDLDVWCSDKLVTSKDYEIRSSYPKMLMVDFENLYRFNFQNALDKDKLTYKESPYYCETVYEPLAAQMYSDFDLEAATERKSL